MELHMPLISTNMYEDLTRSCSQNKKSMNKNEAEVKKIMTYRGTQ